MPDPNVVAFSRQGVRAMPPSPALVTERFLIGLPLDLDRMANVLLHLAVTVELATKLVTRRADYPDETVIDGLRDVFTAFNSLVLAV